MKSKILDMVIILLGIIGIILFIADNNFLFFDYLELFLGIFGTVFGACEYIIDSIKGNTDDK